MVQSIKLGRITLLLLIGILVYTSLSSGLQADALITQGSNTTLSFECLDSITGMRCDSTYSCSISVQYPNQSILLNNVSTTTSGTFYTVNIPDTSILGYYPYTPFCYNGSNGGTSTTQRYFRVTPTGDELSTGQGIIYFLVLFISIVLFMLSLIGAIKIPWKQKRNEEGVIFGINNLKYAKLGLWFLCYIFIIFIFFLMWNISFGFLAFNALTNFFGFLFKSLGYLFAPMFILFSTLGIINFLLDKKLQRRLKHGLKIRR